MQGFAVKIMQRFAVETNGGSLTFLSRRFSSSLLSQRCLHTQIVRPLSGKTSWPELVGTNGDYATSVIKRENPKLYAQLCFEVYGRGRLFTMDFRPNRVWVFVDRNCIVKEIPTFRSAKHLLGPSRS